MAHDVFVSYSRIDKDAADAACSMLEENGIRCWMAPRDITPGKAFSEAIIDGIQSSKVFVLIYSSNSNHSPQVIKEVDRAVHHGLSIINLRLDDEPLSKKLEYYISDVHWMDAVTPPLEQHLNKLLRVVQILLKPEEVKDTEIAEALRKGIIKQNEPVAAGKVSRIGKRRTMLVSGILLAVVIAIVSLIVFNIGGIRQAKAGSIESVVILPFNNYTGAGELETLVSGMHACLIADMGRLSGLRVVNSTTSNVYKNASISVHEIADELKVDGAIEVSVLGIQDSILIQVSLISEFPEEETLWISDYREEKGQILNLYNRITKQIADEIKIRLTADEDRVLAETRNVNPEAIFAYMKGQFHWERRGKQDMDSALYYFQIAIEKDPEWADPYAGMSLTWLHIGSAAYAPLADSYEKASEYLDKALKLDPNAANSHFAKAQMRLNHWDWQEAEKEFLKTLELNPNNALCRVSYAGFLTIMHRTDEAIYQANLALSLDPLHPYVLGSYATVMYRAGRFQTALTHAEKANLIDPDSQFASDVLARAYLKTGDTLKWHEFMKKHWYWADEKYLAYLDTVFWEGGYLAVINDRINVNEKVYSNGGTISYTGQAGRYLEVKDYDKAMDYLEKAYEEGLGALGYISLLVIGYPELKDNQRYIALLKKMNLPMK